MSDNDKKLSMPSKEAERAKALRDNLARRKKRVRGQEDKKDANDQER